MNIKSLAALALLLVFPLSLAGCFRRQPIMFARMLPPGLSPAELQGYKDGVKAAEQDIRRGEPFDVGKHLLFRDPPVPAVVVNEYRQEFRAGYDQMVLKGPPLSSC